MATPVTRGTGAAGPRFVYPVDGQIFDGCCAGSLLLKVNPVPGASGYLWGFKRDGELLWENLRDEGRLSDAEYGIHPGTRAHTWMRRGDVVEAWVRARVGDAWTDATVIRLHFR
jgi:hypothetical protein